MELFERALPIVVALMVAGWFSSKCSKYEYSAKQSFVYGFKVGASCSLGAMFVLAIFDVPGISETKMQGILKVLLIMLLVGVGFGFYCWEQAIKNGR